MKLLKAVVFSLLCTLNGGGLRATSTNVEFEGNKPHFFRITNDGVRKNSYNRHTTTLPTLTKAQAYSLIATDRGVSGVIVFTYPPYDNFMKNRQSPQNPIEKMIINGLKKASPKIQQENGKDFLGQQDIDVKQSCPKASFMEQTPFNQFVLDFHDDNSVKSVVYVVRCIYSNSLQGLVLKIHLTSQKQPPRVLHTVQHAIPKMPTLRLEKYIVKYFKVEVPVGYKVNEDPENDDPDEDHSFWEYKDGNGQYYRELRESLVVSEFTEEDPLWCMFYDES